MNEKVILTMIGSKLNYNVFQKPELYSVAILIQPKKQVVQWESNIIIMNLSLQKVFQLWNLLYMQKLVHFNWVS